MAPWHEFFKAKKLRNVELSMSNKLTDCSIDCSVQSISKSSSTASLISASEFASLKAEVWSLKSSLSESVGLTQNMQEVITNVAQEKYELIEELNKSKLINGNLKEQLDAERDLYLTEKRSYITEIMDFKIKLNENLKYTENLTKENMLLKHSLQEANETIYKIGLLYLKVKNAKDEMLDDLLR